MKTYDEALIDGTTVVFKALFVILMVFGLFGCATPTTGTIAWFENEAGGHTMLTNEPCHIEEQRDQLYRAVATSPTGEQADGCWIPHNEKEVIEAYWWNYEKREWVTRFYERKEFTPTELGRTVPIRHVKP